MNKQTEVRSTVEALRLAEVLREKPDSDGHCLQASAELRRLHALNQELLEALKEMRSCPACRLRTCTPAQP